MLAEGAWVPARSLIARDVDERTARMAVIAAAGARVPAAWFAIRRAAQGRREPAMA
jgi:hypothetical protein